MKVSDRARRRASADGLNAFVQGRLGEEARRGDFSAAECAGVQGGEKVAHEFECALPCD